MKLSLRKLALLAFTCVMVLTLPAHAKTLSGSTGGFAVAARAPAVRPVYTPPPAPKIYSQPSRPVDIGHPPVPMATPPALRILPQYGQQGTTARLLGNTNLAGMSGKNPGRVGNLSSVTNNVQSASTLIGQIKAIPSNNTVKISRPLDNAGAEELGSGFRTIRSGQLYINVKTAKFRRIVTEKAAEVANATNDVVGLGKHAAESIPARSAARDFKTAERAEINAIGSKTGCHTCGSTTPGTKYGNFVPDHQPASALNTKGDPQRLYPQCINCSRKQGLEIARRIREGNK